MRIPLPTALFALAVLAAAADAQVTILVPKDQPTIQAAVNVANDEDKILVSAGTYPENVVINGGHLLFITGKGKVVIAPESGDAVKIEDSDFVFLTNLRTQGGEIGFHLVGSTSCQLVKCRVDDSNGDGVRIEGGATNLLQKMTIEDAGANAVAFATGIPEFTNNNTVIACKLVRPTLDGVGINGTGNQVITTKILDAGRDGIAVEATAPAGSATIERCKILKPVGRGLVFTGDGMLVDRSSIVQSGGHGIEFVDGTGTGVSMTKLIKCGDDGLLIGGDDCELSKLKITKPANEGVVITGDNALVSKCKISAAGANGFMIQGFNGTYTANKSSGATLDGFLLEGMQNTLSLNKASGSGGFDLDNPVPANNTVEADNKFKTQGP
jgi:hypothetical protein